MGFKLERPKATFYLWIKVPEGFTSEDFSLKLLEKAGIICTPGTGFGQHGEGFIRMAMTIPKERMAEAVDRIKKVL